MQTSDDIQYTWPTFHCCRSLRAERTDRNFFQTFNFHYNGPIFNSRLSEEGDMSHPASVGHKLTLITLNVCSSFTIGSCRAAESHSVQVELCQCPMLVHLLASVTETSRPRRPLLFDIFVYWHSCLMWLFCIFYGLRVDWVEP